MSTLSIKNLIFRGIHGVTGREALDPQRFSIDLDIELDTEKAAQTDALPDAYDYRHAIEVVRRVVEGEHYSLIETLVARIADEITTHHLIDAVTVRLAKLNALVNGTPSITLTKKRVPAARVDFLPLDFDVRKIIDELATVGAVSLRALSDTYRAELLKEAKQYEYVEQPRVVGAAKVLEELSSVPFIPHTSLCYQLKNEFEYLLTSKLRTAHLMPFKTPLTFNELSLQQYKPGSIGITPHMDGKSCINLVCVFVLAGRARFALCADRSGKNPINIDASPGNVILMRAPGFLGSDVRPFHFVSDITEERITLGMRQRI